VHFRVKYWLFVWVYMYLMGIHLQVEKYLSI
jgi:hypothetical protein